MKVLSLVISFTLSFFVYTLQGQEENFVESNGVNIHFTIFGEGPPVLIINGGPGFSSEGFVPLAKKIANEGYQTILYDQRGTGKSSMEKVDSTNITMDLMVEDIEAIRKKMNIDEWIVLGHSFGGIMANYYTAQYPSRVKAMISSSSGGIDLSLLRNAQSNLYSKLTQTELDSMRYWSAQRRNGDNSEYAQKQFAKYMAPAYVYDRKFIPVVAERLTQGNMALNRLVWNDLIRIEYDCKPKLRSFDKPVLIIQGKNDIISENLASTADSVFPNSKVVLLDSCGHYGWLDQPVDYFGKIFSFLKHVEEHSENVKKVKVVLQNYIKSIYISDSAMVEKIADSTLQKSGHYYSPRRKTWSYEDMDFEGLQHTAATYNRKKWLPEWAPAEIEIYEVKEKVASAKVKAIWGFDYMLLSKKNGQWMIDKVLWQSYTADEQKEYFTRLKNNWELNTISEKE
ncbi:MAG: alpha/beta fold hydrolase [Brumimicrobium sp.]|nr:alpha/beta fold hydrolase [Brumimicrobium sp.]